MRAPKTSSRARTWREGLGLSVLEAAELQNWDMSNEAAQTRFREIDRSKRQPSGPMLAVMSCTDTIVQATIMLRSGRPDDARRILQQSLTPALMRHVRASAPGVEAVGPKTEAVSG